MISSYNPKNDDDIDELNSKSNTFLSGSKNTEIPYHTNGTVLTISIPSGQWLVINYMSLEKAGNAFYNNALDGIAVRSTEGNGGGSINARVFTGPKDIVVKCYHNISGGSSINDYWYAIKLI